MTKVFCTNCGTENDEGSKFCVGCGENISESVEASAESMSVANDIESAEDFSMDSESESIATGKNNSKLIKKIVIGAVAVAVVIGVVGIVNNIISKNSPVNYEKHPVVYLKDSEIMMANNKKLYELGEHESEFYNSYVQMADDGKTVFFADDYNSNTYEFDLCYRSTSGNPSKEATKIASGVTSVQIIPDGKGVVYLKDDKLYYSDLKEDYKISSGVDYFYFDEEYKKVVFAKSNEDYSDDYYIWNISKKNDKPEKIADDATDIATKDEEYKQVYYISDEKLYFKQEGKDAEKISSNFYKVFVVNGSAYALREDDEDEFSLYKINKDKEEKICEELSRLIWTTEENAIFEKSAGDEATICVLNSKGSLIEMESINTEGDIHFAEISKDNKHIYWTEELDGNRVLYKTELKSDKNAKSEEVCDKVNYFSIYDDFVVITSEDYSVLGVYENGDYKELSDEVGTHTYSKGALYYLEEYDDSKAQGNLVRYKNGKDEEIDSDVHAFVTRSENMCYYIKDYSTNKRYGDLYQLKGKKSEQIDDEVSTILY